MMTLLFCSYVNLKAQKPFYILGSQNTANSEILKNLKVFNHKIYGSTQHNSSHYLPSVFSLTNGKYLKQEILADSIYDMYFSANGFDVDEDGVHLSGSIDDTISNSYASIIDFSLDLKTSKTYILPIKGYGFNYSSPIFYRRNLLFTQFRGGNQDYTNLVERYGDSLTFGLRVFLTTEIGNSFIQTSGRQVNIWGQYRDRNEKPIGFERPVFAAYDFERKAVSYKYPRFNDRQVFGFLNGFVDERNRHYGLCRCIRADEAHNFKIDFHGDSLKILADTVALSWTFRITQWIESQDSVYGLGIKGGVGSLYAISFDSAMNIKREIKLIQGRTSSFKIARVDDSTWVLGATRTKVDIYGISQSLVEFYYLDNTLQFVKRNYPLVDDDTSEFVLYQPNTFSNVKAKKVGPVNGVFGNEPVIKEIHVYPNPAIDKLHIVLPFVGSKTVRAELYNMQGKRLIFQDSDLSNLDISQLPEGSYILCLNIQGVFYRNRILVLHP